MKKKKRIIVLMLSMIMLFGNIIPVSAESPSGSSGFGGSLESNLFLIRSDNLDTDNPITTQIYFGTPDTLSDTTGVLCYPVYSDFTEYITTEEKRVIGFFFLSEAFRMNA